MVQSRSSLLEKPNQTLVFHAVPQDGYRAVERESQVKTTVIKAAPPPIIVLVLKPESGFLTYT